MRRQLQDYRCRGATATREMQLAARKVKAESVRLRILLARCGVPPDEIQAFVELPDEALDPRELAQASRQTAASNPEFGSTSQPVCGPQSSRHCNTNAHPECGVDKSKDYDTPGATSDDTTPLETSCKAAADLIADFQGHEDVANVLMMLGCSGTNDCRVKNTTVFQIMDGVL